MSSNDLPAAITASADLINWLAEQYGDLELPGGTAKAMAYACFAIVLSHHRAITTLMQADLFASAFALIRSQIDAYARGMWLAHVASEDQIDNISAGGDPPNIEAIIKRLEGDGILDPGVLSGIKNQVWAILSDYTHTGIRQMQRHFDGSEIAPNCTAEEKIEALKAADAWALTAAISLLELGGHDERARMVLERRKHHI